MPKTKRKPIKFVTKDQKRANRHLELKFRILFPTTADRLWAFRQARNLSQKEMADEVGLCAGSISRFECGYTQGKSMSLARIARCYGLSVDYLLNLSDSQTIHNPVAAERKAYR